ncbi:hypothetical protein TNCV_1423761 [Trichonephila clavipes]|nr:hypothetical protein TNCV_1423761 [Trichonephila clavipes]
MADKDILEFKQSSKNIITADSNDENKMYPADPVPSSSKIRNRMKSKNGESPEVPPKNLVPELLPTMAAPNAEVCEYTEGNYLKLTIHVPAKELDQGDPNLIRIRICSIRKRYGDLTGQGSAAGER